MPQAGWEMGSSRTLRQIRTRLEKMVRVCKNRVGKVGVVQSADSNLDFTKLLGTINGWATQEWRRVRARRVCVGVRQLLMQARVSEYLT